MKATQNNYRIFTNQPSKYKYIFNVKNKLSTLSIFISIHRTIIPKLITDIAVAKSTGYRVINTSPAIFLNLRIKLLSR